MREVKGYRIQLQIGDNVVSVPAGELGLDWDNESWWTRRWTLDRKGILSNNIRPERIWNRNRFG